MLLAYPSTQTACSQIKLFFGVSYSLPPLYCCSLSLLSLIFLVSFVFLNMASLTVILINCALACTLGFPTNPFLFAYRTVFSELGYLNPVTEHRWSHRHLICTLTANAGGKPGLDTETLFQKTKTELWLWLWLWLS